jgi:hypothetical protein
MSGLGWGARLNRPRRGFAWPECSACRQRSRLRWRALPPAILEAVPFSSGGDQAGVVVGTLLDHAEPAGAGSGATLGAASLAALPATGVSVGSGG